MPCQLAALRALVVAKPTFVWLLPRVTPSVHCQVGTVLENLQRENQCFNFVFFYPKSKGFAENLAAELAGVSSARKLLQISPFLQLSPDQEEPMKVGGSSNQWFYRRCYSTEHLAP